MCTCIDVSLVRRSWPSLQPMLLLPRKMVRALWTTAAAEAPRAESGAPPWVAAASVGVEVERKPGRKEGEKRTRRMSRREEDGEAASVSKKMAGLLTFSRSSSPCHPLLCHHHRGRVEQRALLRRGEERHGLPCHVAAAGGDGIG
jgi:hypothetical protein